MATWNGSAVVDSPVYSMDGVKKGLMLCVETENPGAARDMDIMRRFFEKFGFDYEIIREPTADSMLMSLRILRYNINHSPRPVSCVLIAISCHGNENVEKWNETVLAGSDNYAVTMNNVVNIFSETNCPQLKGIPKIFITDACRGETDDYGVMDGYRHVYDEKHIRQYRTNYRSAVINDMFVAYAASPGHPAFMDSLAGGYMIFCIERVFLDHSTDGIHFMDLFTRVKQCFEKINSIRSVDLPLLTMNMESTLSKLLYLH